MVSRDQLGTFRVAPVRIAISIVVVGAFLIAYVIIEKRISQRTCASCGFRVSRDAPEGCPNCGNERPANSTTVRRWPRFGFIALIAVCIVAAEAAVVLIERGQSETDKAIRLVQESSSRIENFTIQQYLYTTVYKRKDDGEPVTILGWRAEQPDGPHIPVRVEFSFSEGDVTRVAVWDVDPGSGRVTPANESARDWSWNY